ncbi:MAG: glycosyltransferase, partial [Solirubrobacterales bacterium]|nr:glycosyltransferase [Solirubrobacterales bacterium]
MPSERLAIAQVTPFAWEAATDVGLYVAHVSQELSDRGHAVVVIAPSQSTAQVRESRRAIRAAREDPRELLERASGAPLLLSVGELLSLSPTGRRASSLPVGVSRTIEEALTMLPLDVVHVHEPFAPSVASVALRHSRALTVGGFHAPTERILSTQLTRPLSRLLFNRLDARIASYAATAELMQRFFPADYTVVLPGAETAEREADDGRTVRIAMLAEEERSALRTFLRALRALPATLEWRATVWSAHEPAPPATLNHVLRERVEFVSGEQLSERELLARAEIAVFASEGLRPAPGALVRALAAGAVPVASRLPAYEELLGEGEFGFEFEPRDSHTLAAHLHALIEDPARR